LTPAGRALGLYGPPVAWAAAIFGASSQSSIGPAALVPDWITHGSAYAILAFLTCRALAGGMGRPLSTGAFALAVALVTLYGVSDEYHQSFVPRRDASLGDVAKDLGGALVGCTLFRAQRRFRG
jgi:VanZ family protein